MPNRISERDWNQIYADRVRAIEELYSGPSGLHENLLEWGRWGRQRFPGRPRLMLSGIWLLPGDTDPNRDPEAIPSAPRQPFDEVMLHMLDARIHAEDFVSEWRKILYANYVRRLPEYQRHQEARIGAESYIEQLCLALDFLRLAEIA